MKVKFIGETDFVSEGITFINGGVYDLSDNVVKYLQDNFRNIEILEVTKPTEVKAKSVPEVDTKVTPKK
jgi:hypothetical protein